MVARYPAFIDVRRRRCVVIGGGHVAGEKVRKLLESGAEVVVVSPSIIGPFRCLVDEGRVTWVKREYRSGDLAKAFIAVAATGDHTINIEIAREAEERRVLVNVVDDPHLSTFIAPAVVRRGDVAIAVSTGGASPALARKFREELSRSQLLRYADLAPILSEARTELKRLGVKVDPEHWQTCINEELLDLIQAGRMGRAREILLANLLRGRTDDSSGR